MISRKLIFILCLFVLSVCSSFAFAASTQQIQHPILFEPNLGQEDPSVKYFARGPGYKTLLSADGAQLHFRNEEGSRSELRIVLEGSASNAVVKRVGSAKSRVNYFIGNDESKWKTDVPAYAAAIYKDVYPGIDWMFYEKEGLVEFDFVVAPGTDASQIRMRLNDVEEISIDNSGDLIVSIQANKFRMLAPVVYQCDAYESGECKGRAEIKAEYRLAFDQRIEFALESYDPNKTLIIDPKISFGTLLGGNTFDSANDVAVDTKGNFYVVGYTEANTRIPGNGDGFVHKFSPTGALIWSTFLVGSSGEGAGSIAVNPAGICFVGGSTSSRDFPIAGAFQPNFGGSLDGFIVKLAVNGTIMRSSFIGGNGRDFVNHVQLGTGAKLGRGVYLFGSTDSRNFPRKNAVQTQYGGGSQDAFLTIVHAVNFQQLMSTYVGTNSRDESGSLAINPVRGDLYALISNDSTNSLAHFKPVGGGPAPLTNYSVSLVSLNQTALGQRDVNAMGSPWVFLMTVFRPPSTVAFINAAAATPAVGIAYTTCIPQSPGAACNGSGTLQFLDQDLILKKTVNFGATGAGIFINDVVAKKDGAIYLVGDTTSNNLPQINSFQPTRKGGWEAFVMAFAPDTQQVTLSSYLGGPAFDFGSDVAVDNAGNIIVSGQTSSKNFPTTPGAPKRSVTGTADGYVIKITP